MEESRLFIEQQLLLNVGSLQERSEISDIIEIMWTDENNADKQGSYETNEFFGLFAIFQAKQHILIVAGLKL